MKIETGRGLWVSDSFTRKFGNEEIKPSKEVPAYRTLGKDMTDDDIFTEFGIKECSLSDVAAFLKNPPEGTDDGYTNIFYIKDGPVAGLFWGAVSGRWNLDDWSRGGSRWNPGYRAFGATVPSASLSSSETSDSLTVRVEKLEKIIERLRKVF